LRPNNVSDRFDGSQEDKMACFVFVALQGNWKTQNENCKIKIVQE